MPDLRKILEGLQNAKNPYSDGKINRGKVVWLKCRLLNQSINEGQVRLASPVSGLGDDGEIFVDTNQLYVAEKPRLPHQLMPNLADALTALFFKLPPPYGYSATDIDAVAAFWVAELADKGIMVAWNRQEQRFEEDANA